MQLRSDAPLKVIWIEKKSWRPVLLRCSDADTQKEAAFFSTCNVHVLLPTTGHCCAVWHDAHLQVSADLTNVSEDGAKLARVIVLADVTLNHDGSIKDCDVAQISQVCQHCSFAQGQHASIPSN